MCSGMYLGPRVTALARCLLRAIASGPEGGETTWRIGIPMVYGRTRGVSGPTLSLPVNRSQLDKYSWCKCITRIRQPLQYLLSTLPPTCDRGPGRDREHGCWVRGQTQCCSKYYCAARQESFVLIAIVIPRDARALRLKVSWLQPTPRRRCLCLRPAAAAVAFGRRAWQ
mgnify:CR=1 FL=1